MRVTIAMGALLLALSPAIADEPACPPDNSLPVIVAQVEKGGGKLLSLDNVPGKDFDQIAVFHMGSAIVIGGVLNGCVVTPPMPVFEASGVAKTSLGV